MVTASMKRLIVALYFGLALMMLARTASADPRTTYLADQLKSNDDYRVRTQAALALGASADDAAVKPLCDAVGGDSNVSVRVAAAAALGKLGKQGGMSCLQSAKSRESQGSVKSQIDKSISALQNGAGPPPPGADAKY